MTTKVQIRNIQPATKEVGGEAKTVEVKVTGGGPPVTHNVAPGQDLEIDVSGGRKVTLGELGSS